MAADKQAGGDPIIIKKYANRRLYNTQSSSYITLDDLARMTREGTDFQVLDAKTGADITHAILTQIIMEEESHGEQMLPVSFLRNLISMYGNSMQALMPQYLEATMDNFRTNQRKMQDSWSASMGPDALAKLAESNMAMFQAAASAFMPGGKGVGGTAPAPAAQPSQGAAKQDIDALRDQLAAVQKRLDSLSE
jgi:polyhydroxyalkanoate synthesis repressor PhaR